MQVESFPPIHSAPSNPEGAVPTLDFSKIKENGRVCVALFFLLLTKTVLFSAGVTTACHSGTGNVFPGHPQGYGSKQKPDMALS